MSDRHHGILEPQALERPDDDGRVRLSIAISLMRIADALEKANEPPLEICELAPTPAEISARPGERMACAMEKIAERFDHSTHYFDAGKALIRTSAA